MNKEYLISILSTSIFHQFYDYVAFSCRKSETKFDTSSLIITVDVDVGNAEVGFKNGGRNDRNVSDFLTERGVGKIEEQVVPLLLDAFNELEIPVTFALRGQLTEVENSIINLILESSTRHEIAAHGYSHRVFASLTKLEAEGELRKISAGMKKFGITPKSFVFPQNVVCYLHLLERFGYLTFRGRGNFLGDRMYVGKCGNLYDVHQGRYLGFNDSVSSKMFINLAVKYRAPLHIWFHPWNLGNSPEVAAERIDTVLLPLIKHARKMKKQGVLKFETMCSIAEEYRCIEKISSCEKGFGFRR